MGVLSGAALAYPIWGRAQQPATPVIGFLSGALSSGPRAPDLDGLRQGLAESGYIEGRNLTVEHRWAEGRFDRLPALAEDLTSRHVALIATVTLAAAVAAKAASPTTPVVFVIGEDSVKAGLVASLNQPGGNATGVSDFVNVLVAKRLELIGQTVPGVASVGLLVNPNNPNAASDAKETEAQRTRLDKNCWW